MVWIKLADKFGKHGLVNLVGSVTLSFGRHYGLVGRNGTGKTTSLKYMTMHAIDGVPRNCHILHVEQEVGDDTLALQCVLNADVKIFQLLNEIARLIALQRGLEFKTATEKCNTKLDEALAIYAYSQKIEQVSNRLEFMDADSVESRAASILAVVTDILHLQAQKLTAYMGNYDTFERIRDKQLKNQKQAFDTSEKPKAHMQLVGNFMEETRVNPTFINDPEIMSSPAKCHRSKNCVRHRCSEMCCPLSYSNSYSGESQAASQSELFERHDCFIERYAESLNLSLDAASSMITKISNGQMLVEDIRVHIMSLTSFGVFLASWRLSSHALYALTRVDTVVEKYTQEKLRDMLRPLLSSPEKGLSFVIQIVAEPIAWKGLVIQSCIQVTPKLSEAGASCPSGRRKKIRREHPVVKLTSEMTQSISSSIQSSCGIVEGIIKVLKTKLNILQVGYFQTSLQKPGITEGPGHFIQARTPSSDYVGPKVARKMVKALRKTLLVSLNI